MTTESPFPSTFSRTCGSCYSCCTWLGIDELKKWPGKACQHLTGARGPEHRCGIYSSRPHTCQLYHCAWIEGLGTEEARPDKSGLLITPYKSELSTSSPFSVSIVVIDHVLAGSLTSGHLGQIIDTLLKLGVNEIRVINFKTKSAILFLNGEVRNCQLIRQPPGEYEGLTLLPQDPPFAHYRTFSSQTEAQTWLEQNPQTKSQVLMS